MSKITDLTAQLAPPCGGGQRLFPLGRGVCQGRRAAGICGYIDKETGVSIDDCEAVSRVLSDLLDEADPIQDPLHL